MFVPPCRKTGTASNWKFPMWKSGPESRKTSVWSAPVIRAVAIPIASRLRWVSIEPFGRSTMAAV